MTDRVIIHVGAPKTGTSFVQSVLFDHRFALATEGLRYPGDRFDAHFLAALDLLQLPWGGLEKEAVGAWDRLVEEVRRPGALAVISHEILAIATRAQVARAMASFGDAEVHVVYSARDLVRQIPAEWQENVKHRRRVSYAKFLAKIQDPERSSRLASWFWGVQEVPDVLARWGDTLPPERVHLVTVPRPGAPRELLWERFAGILGIDAERYRPERSRVNASLGVPESALIRRLNVHAIDRIPPEDYRPLVRELLVHQTLSQRTDSARLALPPDVHAWATELSETWIEALGKRGYDVIGDLAELRPDPPTGDFVDPDAPDEAQVAEAGVEALAVAVEEAVRLRGVERDLRHEVDRLHAELQAAYLRPTYRVREKFVEFAARNRAAAWVYGIYRRARGNSSREA
ncbi:hypothetical protein [Nocardioides massiliensis]|uniref:Sulfotransferase family protein n=1 Tax=Nocardioides massiliensis TaxID=1325935 RepID=A0ABT9NN28_9ACTN|nr:hypothetical protein [Nocardioides massiliensis]MDP9821240.1 hypothetical protein [Nocardioides massiliensis]